MAGELYTRGMIAGANAERERNKEEIELLTERCEAYKGQVKAGAVVIERLRTALSTLRDACWEFEDDEAVGAACRDADAALAESGSDIPSRPSDGGSDIDSIIRDVAELPDRTSPEDCPEAMLVTQDELRVILSRHLARP